MLINTILAATLYTTMAGVFLWYAIILQPSSSAQQGTHLISEKLSTQLN